MTPIRCCAVLVFAGLAFSPTSCGEAEGPPATTATPLATSVTPTSDPADQDPVQAPRLRIRMSGNLQGYLMPCGCASGQLGGLGRRSFRNKMDRRSTDLLLEGGHLMHHLDPLELSKHFTALEVLSLDGYHARGLAGAELKIERELLTGLLAAYTPAIASDLTLAGGKRWELDGKPVVHAFHEEKLPHVTVRIAALMMSLPEGETVADLELLAPDKAWAGAMEGVDPSSYRIAMIHASGREAKKLRLEPPPDLIVCVGPEHVEPPATADTAGDVPLVHTGAKGRVLLDVTLVRGPNGPMLTRYQPVPLEGSKTAKDAMQDGAALAVIHGHRTDVAQENLLEKMASQEALAEGQGYVGDQSCAECHDQEVAKCQDHAHSHAWKTLIDAEKREEWPVTKYPECVSCHVVGYGKKTGFITPEKTPKLLNVGCETCHGPGKKHVDEGGDPEFILGSGDGNEWQVRSCLQCHNFEHSPNFAYTPYWEKIEHGK